MTFRSRHQWLKLPAELAALFGGEESSLENGNATYTDEFNLPSDTEISEDCLNLNVWTPVSGGTDMPVIVYIHGGGFTGDGSSIDMYDGESIAENGVVYVSINYRVGILGYLATSELAEEDELSVIENGEQDRRDRISRGLGFREMVCCSQQGHIVIYFC